MGTYFSQTRTILEAAPHSVGFQSQDALNSVGWRLLSWKSRRDETTYRTSNRKTRIPKESQKNNLTKNGSNLTSESKNNPETVKTFSTKARKLFAPRNPKNETYVSSVMSFEYANVPYVSSGSNNLVEETGEFFRLKKFLPKILLKNFFFRNFFRN